MRRARHRLRWLVAVTIAATLLGCVLLARMNPALNLALTLALPGGESSRQATQRGMSALEEILADDRQPAVVASHGNLISLLLHAFDGRPGLSTWEQLTNPDVFEVVYEPATERSAARWQATRTWTP